MGPGLLVPVCCPRRLAAKLMRADAPRLDLALDRRWGPASRARCCVGAQTRLEGASATTTTATAAASSATATATATTTAATATAATAAAAAAAIAAAATASVAAAAAAKACNRAKSTVCSNEGMPNGWEDACARVRMGATQNAGYTA